MRKDLVLFMITGLLIVLTACSNKPSDVSQEVWDNGIQVTLYIDKETSKGELIDTDIFAIFSEDVDSLTEKEREIYLGIIDLSQKSLSYQIATFRGGTGEVEKEEYDMQFEELEKIFGKSNLKQSKFDEDKLKVQLTKQKEKQEQKIDEKRQEFKDKYKVSLTANEVQYNMPNNVDKDFYIEGTLEFCDYYNYGYTNEKKFYCGRLTPFNGGFSDSWYLYFNREDFKGIYELLISGEKVDLMAIATIPLKSYKSGQGNMAGVRATGAY